MSGEIRNMNLRSLCNTILYLNRSSWNHILTKITSSLRSQTLMFTGLKIPGCISDDKQK